MQGSEKMPESVASRVLVEGMLFRVGAAEWHGRSRASWLPGDVAGLRVDLVTVVLQIVLGGWAASPRGLGGVTPALQLCCRCPCKPSGSLGHTLFCSSFCSPPFQLEPPAFPAPRVRACKRPPNACERGAFPKCPLCASTLEGGKPDCRARSSLPCRPERPLWCFLLLLTVQCSQGHPLQRLGAVCE